MRMFLHFQKEKKIKGLTLQNLKVFSSPKAMPHICLDIPWVLFDHGKALIEFITVLDYEYM